ncbi:hypothetical protein OH492_12570 [Vibrio chagasii]|nr:hypothetical protein [Vibrio chagasii]
MITETAESSEAIRLRSSQLSARHATGKDCQYCSAKSNTLRGNRLHLQAICICYAMLVSGMCFNGMAVNHKWNCLRDKLRRLKVALDSYRGGGDRQPLGIAVTGTKLVAAKSK